MSRPLNRRKAIEAVLLGTSTLAGGLVAGCAGGQRQVASTGSISPGQTASPETPARQGPAAGAPKVALLLPLGGGPQIAAIAEAMKQAAELAVADARTRPLELIVKDDKGTETGAQAAAEDAIKSGAGLLIGPMFSKSVKAAAPVARAANVPLVSLSNDPSVATAGIYMLGASQAAEVERVIGYAASQGCRRFAGLLPADAEGRVLEPEFKAAVARAGGVVAAIERYQFEGNGLIDLPRARREGFKAVITSGEAIDALFLPGGQDTLPQLAGILGQAGLATGNGRVRLLGTSGWDYPNVWRQTRLHGGWFPAPDPKQWHDFAERFGRAHGSMPPRLATLAHDAVQMAISLADAPSSSRFQAANLTRSQGFAGADGTFRFSASGTVERGLAILELQKAAPAVVDAPALPGAAARAHASSASPRFN